MKRLLFENIGLKVLAILIALALWAFVGSRQVLERRMNLRIEYTDIPANVSLAPNIKTAVQALLIGRKESVLDLSPEDLKAVVSLKSYQAGQREILVHPRVQPLPTGVTANVIDLTVPLVLPSDTKDKSKKKGHK